MSDETGQHQQQQARASDGGISEGMLKTIAAVVSIVGIIIGGAMALGRLDASIAEFRQQYNRDSAESRADLRSALTQLVEVKQRVTVLETQRSADERSVVSRITALESTLREITEQRIRNEPRR